MDERSLQEAVENITVIRGVIEKTRQSFTAFSRIFIYWGILFIGNSLITLYMFMNKEQMMEIAVRYPLFNYVFPIALIALLAAFIYRQIAKKIPLVGLEKHLMKIWLLILIMNIIPAKISVNTPTAVDISTVTIQSNNFSVVLFSLAIALIVTGLFTGYKQLIYVAAVYIGISILHAYFNLPVFSGTIVQLLYLISLPFTFLYTGFFLKTQQARGQ